MILKFVHIIYSLELLIACKALISGLRVIYVIHNLKMFTTTRTFYS